MFRYVTDSPQTGPAALLQDSHPRKPQTRSDSGVPVFIPERRNACYIKSLIRPRARNGSVPAGNKRERLSDDTFAGIDNLHTASGEFAYLVRDVNKVRAAEYDRIDTVRGKKIDRGPDRFKALRPVRKRETGFDK